MRKNNILITGINGFIGSSLAEYIAGGYKSWVVCGVDKNMNGKGSHTFDITNKNKLTALLAKVRPRYIFHFSGATNQHDFDTLLSSNVYAAYVLFEAVRSIKKYNPRIFIPGSAAGYGDMPLSRMPIKENRSLLPISLYGFSKKAQEELSLFYVSKGLNIVVGRIFNIVGKGIPLHFSIGRFAYELALIKKGKKPILYTKNLDSKRDFLDIDDVCKYVVHIVMHGRPGEVYNICRGESYRIGDLLGMLIEISGIKNVKIISRRNEKDNDISDSFGSTKKLNKILKLNIKPIEKSLQDVYLYYLNQKNGVDKKYQV